MRREEDRNERNAKPANDANVVRLTPAAVQSAGITIETVTSAALTASSLTGAVEPNQQQLQQVTALTNGRIELASPTGFEPVLPP